MCLFHYQRQAAQSITIANLAISKTIAQRGQRLRARLEQRQQRQRRRRQRPTAPTAKRLRDCSPSLTCEQTSKYVRSRVLYRFTPSSHMAAVAFNSTNHTRERTLSKHTTLARLFGVRGIDVNDRHHSWCSGIVLSKQQ